MKIGTLVKFSDPINAEEADLIFVVKNFNEVTNVCLCECQNLPGFEQLKPISTLGIEHLTEIK